MGKGVAHHNSWFIRLGWPSTEISPTETCFNFDLICEDQWIPFTMFSNPQKQYLIGKWCCLFLWSYTGRCISLFFNCPNYAEIRLIVMNNLNWVQTSDLNLLTCGSDDITYEENINIIKHVFNFIKSVIVRFVDIGGIDDHHYLSFLFISIEN